MVTRKSAGERLAQKLGANIATRRKARKWSQEDLAERLAVATETISRFERGATLPSLVTLQQISHVLRVPMAELLTESSGAPGDQALVIASWISDLRDDDREYVMGVVKMACDYFSHRRS